MPGSFLAAAGEKRGVRARPGMNGTSCAWSGASVTCGSASPGTTRVPGAMPARASVCGVTCAVRHRHCTPTSSRGYGPRPALYSPRRAAATTRSVSSAADAGVRRCEHTGARRASAHLTARRPRARTSPTRRPTCAQTPRRQRRPRTRRCRCRGRRRCGAQSADPASGVRSAAVTRGERKSHRRYVAHAAELGPHWRRKASARPRRQPSARLRTSPLLAVDAERDASRAAQAQQHRAALHPQRPERASARDTQRGARNQSQAVPAFRGAASVRRAGTGTSARARPGAAITVTPCGR